MEKSQILVALQKVKTESQKRNFKQTIDLVATLKDIDLKKTENQVDFFVQLHYSRGRKVKVCGLIGAELKDDAEKVLDKTILLDDFEKYAKDKKLTKKVADEYDYFIGQATIMPKIAATFGRVFGSRGKMPNPKSGCIIPPNANIKALYDKLQKTIRVSAKTSPAIMAPVGKEDMPEDEILENILMVYNTLIHNLPNGELNIKTIALKFTMGKPVRL